MPRARCSSRWASLSTRSTSGASSRARPPAVFGCGPIGLLLVQALRDAGATVTIATDRLQHRVDAAAALGATAALEAGGGRPAGRRGVDVAFEAPGDDAALADAIDAVRPGGPS